MKETLLVVLLVIIGFLAVGILITNIVFSFDYQTYDLSNDTIIEVIQKDLNSKLISNINIRQTCQNGEEELVLEKWDGTPDVCYCDGKETPCESKTDYCTTTKGIPAKNITVINGKKICIERGKKTIKDYFKEKNIYSKNENCPDDYISCGIIDTLDRKLCIKNSENCPINSNNVELQQALINFKLYNNNYSVYSENVYNNYFLNEEENNNDTIISTFKLSNGYPCIDVSERSWKLYLPKNQISTKTCSSYIKGTNIDKRYIKFNNFQTKYIQLYEKNELNEYITNELKNDNTSIDLYGRAIFGINNPDDFDYDKIISIQDTSNTCNNIMKIVSFIMIGVVLSPIFAICGIGQNSSNCNGQSAEKAAMVFAAIIIIVIVIGFLIHFVVCIIIYISIQRLKWILVDNSKIGDDYTNEMFKLLIDSYSSNYKYALGIMIVIAIMFSCGIISLILHFFSKKRNMMD